MPSFAERSHFLLPLSAKTEKALDAQIRQFAGFIKDHPALSIADICYTAGVGRMHLKHRAVAIGDGREAILAALERQEVIRSEGAKHSHCRLRLGLALNGCLRWEITGEPTVEMAPILQSLQEHIHQETTDWSSLICDLAILYILGANIDWQALDEPYPRNKVSLPTYLFQHERYWIELSAASQHQALERITHHPLLSGQIASSARDKIVEADVDLTKQVFLQDHRIFDHVIFPGAGYVELAIGALKQLRPEGDICLTSLSLLQALELTDKSQTLQVIMTPEAGALEAYEIAYNSTRDGVWVLHAKGHAILTHNHQRAGAISIEVLKARSQEVVNLDALYSELAKEGFLYGPAFQVLREVHITSEHVLAHLVLTEEAHRYFIHPALLDGCFQAMTFALKDKSEANQAYMPVMIEGVHYQRPLGQSAWAFIDKASLEETVDGFKVAMTMYDEEGQLQLTVESLQVKAVTRAQLKSILTTKTDISDWYYEWTW